MSDIYSVYCIPNNLKKKVEAAEPVRRLCSTLVALQLLLLHLHCVVNLCRYCHFLFSSTPLVQTNQFTDIPRKLTLTDAKKSPISEFYEYTFSAVQLTW